MKKRKKEGKKKLKIGREIQEKPDRKFNSFMKQVKSQNHFSLFLIMILFLSSCQAIAGIFKAGVWVGVVGLIIIIAIIFWIIGKIKK